MFDLHMHTVFSDGRDTPEEMVREAIRKGLETVGISDHSTGDPCGMTHEDRAAYKALPDQNKDAIQSELNIIRYANP